VDQPTVTVAPVSEILRVRHSFGIRLGARWDGSRSGNTDVDSYDAQFWHLKWTGFDANPSGTAPVTGRGRGSLVQSASLQCQNSEGTRASNNPSLRGGGRVNVRIENAGFKSFKLEGFNFFLEIIGEGFADVGVQVEPRATGVRARFDGSRGCLNKKDRKYIGFTTADVDARVDIERAMGMAYSFSLRIASRGVSRGSISNRGVNGGSIDCDDEDGADDGEELSRKHHGVG